MYDALFAQGGLSLERLRTFCTIVRAKGIGAGAGDDPVRQSQFSRQLRELERFFGTELIHRGRGPTRLSPAGEDLLRLVSPLLSGLEELVMRCHELPVSLRVGAGESLIQWWLLPRLPPDGWAEPSRITPIFDNRRNDGIIEGILDGSLDLGVTTRSVEGPRLEARSLAPLKYRLFVPDRLLSSASAKAGTIPDDLPIAELAESRRISEALDQEWSRRRAVPRRVLKLSSYPQLAAVVTSGRAAAVLPDFAGKHLGSGLVHVLSPSFLDPLDGELRLVWNSGMLDVRPAIARALPVLTRAWST